MEDRYTDDEYRAMGIQVSTMASGRKLVVDLCGVRAGLDGRGGEPKEVPCIRYGEDGGQKPVRLMLRDKDCTFLDVKATVAHQVNEIVHFFFLMRRQRQKDMDKGWYKDIADSAREANDPAQPINVRHQCHALCDMYKRMERLRAGGRDATMYALMQMELTTEWFKEALRELGIPDDDRAAYLILRPFLLEYRDGDYIRKTGDKELADYVPNTEEDYQAMFRYRKVYHDALHEYMDSIGTDDINEGMSFPYLPCVNEHGEVVDRDGAPVEDPSPLGYIAATGLYDVMSREEFEETKEYCTGMIGFLPGRIAWVKDHWQEEEGCDRDTWKKLSKELNELEKRAKKKGWA